MIDAKEEIVNAILAKTRVHPVLSQVEDEDILEFVDHLFEMQFKPNESKTKKFIDQKITEIASGLVRKEAKETAGG